MHSKKYQGNQKEELRGKKPRAGTLAVTCPRQVMLDAFRNFSKPCRILGPSHMLEKTTVGIAWTASLLAPLQGRSQSMPSSASVEHRRIQKATSIMHATFRCILKESMTECHDTCSHQTTQITHSIKSASKRCNSVLVFCTSKNGFRWRMGPQLAIEQRVDSIATKLSCGLVQTGSNA